MQRREMLRLLGGTALWPVAGNAQPSPTRRLGVLFVLGEENLSVPLWVSALKDGLQKAGWAGDALQIVFRFGQSDAERIKRYANELLDLRPDVILAQGVVGAAAMQKATRSVPVVFVQVQDPVRGGFVESIARPNGNLTGFTNFEYPIVSKWLQLLKDVSPGITRSLAIINPDNRARWSGYNAAFDKYAPQLDVQSQMAGVHGANDIEQAIAEFARVPNGALVVLPDATIGVHGKLIIDLAARHRIPAVYSNSSFVRMGGLMSYSDSIVDQYRNAASYIDRILRGTKVSDLPVQATDRFETVINLKTAAALGITVPPVLLASADEIIE